MHPKPRTPAYVVRSGSILYVREATRSQAREAAEVACRHWALSPVIEPIEVAPDGLFVITSPWAGGTWGGRCGSTCWIDDPDYRLDFRQDRSFYQKTQAWHHYRLVGSKNQVRYDDRDLLGFRVECEQPHHHEGECTAEPFRWPGATPTEWEIENRFRYTGQLQTNLVLA